VSALRERDGAASGTALIKRAKGKSPGGTKLFPISPGTRQKSGGVGLTADVLRRGSVSKELFLRLLTKKAKQINKERRERIWEVPEGSGWKAPTSWGGVNLGGHCVRRKKKRKGGKKGRERLQASGKNAVALGLKRKPKKKAKLQG